MKYANIREEELKNKIAHDYFNKFDWTKIIGNIDFCVAPKIVAAKIAKQNIAETESLLWAEAKKGKADIYASLVQLILTIGKARTFDQYLPPAFLGAFDGEKIAFIPYNEIHDIFYISDFNWSVTPSDHTTKEFKAVLKKVTQTIENNSLLFHFTNDDAEIKSFIKSNFIVGKIATAKTQIDKNNFMIIYNKWLKEVKPTIFVDWKIARKKNIIDGDFYLADLLSINNESIKNKLSILLKSDHYVLKEKGDELGQVFRNVLFADDQKAHTQFWYKYERPPEKIYWDYIVERRDLLVPQDVRERKGSFFTPQIWVELSQKYLADVLGENWQDEYYIWDCAAGTGNLLAGLTNKYNVWASTLDQQDVEVMKDRIKNGANLLESHVFQFDFLNDDFTRLPKSLQSIINDPKKRQKLLIYINPPYAEAGNTRERVGTSKSKPNTANSNAIYFRYKNVLGNASKEIFTQFLIRIYKEIPHCKIANFSTLKNLQASNFASFREVFLAELEKVFLVPADTFDNVNGKFPIGFFIWNTEIKAHFAKKKADVYDQNAKLVGRKNLYSYDNTAGKINKWLHQFDDKNADGYIGYLMGDAPDFQNNNVIAIQSKKGTRHGIYFSLCQHNLLVSCIYFAVRKCIKQTWLNDREQFLFPNKKWETDTEFQNDCFAYTLFNNAIQSKYGTNHWLPFTDREINASENFTSNFMTQFIAGKIEAKKTANLLGKKSTRKSPLNFSASAKAAFAAGKKLWQYYHAQPHCNVNASLYDIREHFQGRNAKGKMNNKSQNEKYNSLIGDLRDNLKILAKKIEPKVYEYGFLKK